MRKGSGTGNVYDDVQGGHLTFESVDKVLKYSHSNESCGAIFSCGIVYYAVHGGSKVSSL